MAKGQDDPTDLPFVPAGLVVRGVTPSDTPKPDKEPQSSPPDQTAFDLANRPLDEGGFPAWAMGAPPRRGFAFRPMPVLTLLSALCLALLLWLGQWQWEKFKLKSQPALPTVTQAPVPVSAALEAPNPEYRRVIVDGLADKRTLMIGAVQDDARGFRIFTPIILEAGVVFVDRGFVEESALARVSDLPTQVSLVGVLRKGAKANAYTPDNVPAQNQWYWPDIAAMTQILGLQGGPSGDYYVALSQVDPLKTGTLTDNPYANVHGANPIPAERHLGYALTWWGFGVALLGVYIGLHVRTGRLILGGGHRPSPADPFKNVVP
ncbi:MAG: hypothetical protein RLZZ157_1078 [Pseudomonadota bacterium]|jgi:surfeit locus 1 family protein